MIIAFFICGQSVNWTLFKILKYDKIFVLNEKCLIFYLFIFIFIIIQYFIEIGLNKHQSLFLPSFTRIYFFHVALSPLPLSIYLSLSLYPLFLLSISLSLPSSLPLPPSLPICLSLSLISSALSLSSPLSPSLLLSPLQLTCRSPWP